MIASTTRAAYCGARSELETEVEYILDGLDEHGGSYVSDDEPYPGFHGPWVYVDGGVARLLCRWVVDGPGDIFAADDDPDGDFGDLTLDILDLPADARAKVDAWAAVEAADLLGGER